MSVVEEISDNEMIIKNLNEKELSKEIAGRIVELCEEVDQKRALIHNNIKKFFVDDGEEDDGEEDDGKDDDGEDDDGEDDDSDDDDNHYNSELELLGLQTKKKKKPNRKRKRIVLEGGAGCGGGGGGGSELIDYYRIKSALESIPYLLIGMEGVVENESNFAQALSQLHIKKLIRFHNIYKNIERNISGSTDSVIKLRRQSFKKLFDDIVLTKDDKRAKLDEFKLRMREKPNLNKISKIQLRML